MDFYKKKCAKQNIESILIDCETKLKSLQETIDETTEENNKKQLKKLEEEINKKIKELQQILSNKETKNSHYCRQLLEQYEICLLKIKQGDNIPSKIKTTIAVTTATNLPTKINTVMLNEVEDKLKLMRQKRLNRLSTFVDEQTKLSEMQKKTPRDINVEEAIKKFNQHNSNSKENDLQASRKIFFVPATTSNQDVNNNGILTKSGLSKDTSAKIILQAPNESRNTYISPKVVLKTTSAENIGKSKKQEEKEYILKPLRKTYHDDDNKGNISSKNDSTNHKSRIEHPTLDSNQIETNSKIISPKSIQKTANESPIQDVPSSPNTKNIRKLWHKFGACVVEQNSKKSNEDLTIDNNDLIKEIEQHFKQGENFDKIEKKINKNIEKHSDIDRYCETYEEIGINTQLEEKNSFKTNRTNFNIENPLYDCSVEIHDQDYATNHFKSLINEWEICKNIIQKKPNAFSNNNLEKNIDNISNMFSHLKQEIISECSNQIHTRLCEIQLNNIEQQLTSQKHIVQHFNGVKRDVSYSKLSNSLSSSLIAINNIICEHEYCHRQKRLLNIETDKLIEILENKVSRNEKLLKEILEEQVLVVAKNRIKVTMV